MPIHAHFYRRAILTREIGHTDLVFVCHQDSSAGLCRQDYKSLCAAVMIGSTLVNIRTHPHAHTDSILISLFDKLSELS